MGNTSSIASLGNGKYIPAIGFITILVTGICTCVLLVLAALWCTVQVSLLILQAAVSTLSAISTTFTAASPDIRLVVLGIVAIVLYRAYQYTRKGAIQ